MIGYITVGTNDLATAAGFYDTLFGLMGAGRFMQDERFIAWAVAPDKPGFSVSIPFDGKPANVGNGSMTALVVDSSRMVDNMHAKALELGGSDEGAPGQRMEGFYAAYFRDLDGNKLAVFCQSA